MALRRGRRVKKGKITGLCLIAIVIVVGIVFFVRNAGKTSYANVDQGLEEKVVKANETLLDAKTGKELKDNLYVPRKIDKTKKLIAFTFDDGPKKGNTERVVKALEKNDARATFFMLGQNAAIYPDMVKLVYESGNEVAGHSNTHPSLTKIGAAGVKKEITKMNSSISKTTGSNVALVRPPFGAYNDMVRSAIDTPLILWSVDTLDWKTRNADATVKCIMKHAKDGDIILMHDIHIQSVEAVEKVLPKLKAAGYEVCTVSELMEAKGIKLNAGDVVISANQIMHKN